jgi:hypothetical protein
MEDVPDAQLSGVDRAGAPAERTNRTRR